MRFRTLMIALVVLGFVAAACGGEDADVTVTLRDDGIDLSDATPAAGSLTFEGINEGTATHEFEVFGVPEGVDADALPVEDGVAAADEMLTVIDEVEDIAPGTSARLTVNLEPGTYALICNLPGHYGAGMHRTFTVA
jgi:uncharacterized cupredoxin-like copper-binding protein